MRAKNQLLDVDRDLAVRFSLIAVVTIFCFYLLNLVPVAYNNQEEVKTVYTVTIDPAVSLREALRDGGILIQKEEVLNTTVDLKERFPYPFLDREGNKRKVTHRVVIEKTWDSDRPVDPSTLERRGEEKRATLYHLAWMAKQYPKAFKKMLVRYGDILALGSPYVHTDGQKRVPMIQWWPEFDAGCLSARNLPQSGTLFTQGDAVVSYATVNP